MTNAHVEVAKNISNVVVNKPRKPRKYKGFRGFSLIQFFCILTTKNAL